MLTPRSSLPVAGDRRTEVRRGQSPSPPPDRDPGPQPIGAVLAELLAQYEARFPGLRVAVIETPANAM
jgi:hypothetical protein